MRIKRGNPKRRVSHPSFSYLSPLAQATFLVEQNGKPTGKGVARIMRRLRAIRQIRKKSRSW